jgi:hypothetical protein
MPAMEWTKGCFLWPNDADLCPRALLVLVLVLRLVK